MESVDYRAVIGAIKDEAGSIIDIDSNKGRIKRLIHKGALTLTSSATLINRTIEFTYDNGSYALPCDLVRILRITDKNGCKVGWNRQKGNSYVHMAHRSGTAHLYYKAIPLVEIVSDDGKEQVISIIPEAIDYLAFYVISVLIREQWMKGIMTPDKLQYYEEKMDNARGKAKGSGNMLSIDEVESMINMMHQGMFIGRH